MAKKFYNSIGGGNNEIRIWSSGFDLSRLADDTCANKNCDGSLMEDGHNIVCDSCPFSISRDVFDKEVAKELGTHGDTDVDNLDLTD